jgi:glycosyltransferase involved in cell wall biosynthesis
MKILYACHQFLPEYYTGTERYTLELAKQMQKMGHHVMVLTYSYLSNEGMQPFAKGQLLNKVYQYDRVPVIAWRHADLHPRVMEPELSFRLQDDYMEEAFEKFLQEHTFDILHITHLMRVSPILKVAKCHGLKVVMHLTDYWMICPKATLLKSDGSLCEGPNFGRNCGKYCYETKWTQALRERYHHAQNSLHLVDVIISPSQFLINVFKKNGVDISRFIYLKHGFDYSKVKFFKKGKLVREGIITFGFLGTILPHKGVHVLIEAFKKVALDNIRLKIYGGYFERSDYYQSLLQKVGDDVRIKFCGEYDFEDVSSVLQEIDVVVVPSVWYENAPLTISTAHAHGVPVIATDLGGMAEMVHDGLDGFTFRMGDSSDLAEKIRLLATNPGLLEKFSQAITPPPRIEGDAFYLEQIYTKLLRNEALIVYETQTGHVPQKGV